MSETTILLLCLAAIVISIAICFKTGINMGLIAMTFAFLIGCLFMGEKAAATGINTVALYAAAQIGALATPISPFSTAGAQFVGLAPDDKLSDTLVKQQFLLAIVMMAATTVAALFGLCGIFKL